MKYRFFLSFLALLASFGPALAHPHVWVAVDGEVIMNGDGAVVGLRYRWTFDEAYSAYAIQGLDTNGDGALSRDELQPLAKVNAESLSEYDYFTNPVRGDMQMLNAFKSPSDYWLDWNGRQLTLNMTIATSSPIEVKSAPVAFETFDPSYYISFDYIAGETMTLADGAPGGCSARLERAATLDGGLSAQLSQYGNDEAVPAELLTQVSGLANAVIVSCQ